MKLHLGSADKILTGFVNADIRMLADIDVQCDAMRLPFDVDAFRHVYMCHGLEHFTFTEAYEVLEEIRRVLVGRGKVSLSVPDMDALIKLYTVDGLRLEKIQYAICGGGNYRENAHFSIWNEHTLSALLTEAGFSNVKRRKTFVFADEINDWSGRKMNGRFISLNVSAEKI